jgi:hypothetical protein
MIHELKQQVKELEDKIRQIQSECSHPKSCTTKEYLGDEQDDYGGFISSGNYLYVCSLCEGRWVE